MRTISVFIYLLVINFFFTQNDKKINDFFHIPKPIGLRFEIKNFFINSNRLKIQEIKPFYELNENLKMGFGYCWLKENNYYFKDSNLLRINSSNFFSSYRWRVSKILFAEATIDFGVGKIKSVSNSGIILKGHYSFFEPAIILNFEEFNFFNLGIGSGIRFSRKDNSVLSDNLSLPTIILRFSLKFTEIYNHFFNPSNSSLYLQDD